MKFIVTKKAMRPASKKKECFYCHQDIGKEHNKDCVLIHKKVIVNASYEIEVPADWSPDNIEFNRNESSWCASNMIEELKELNKKGCLCGKVEFSFKSEKPEIYLDEK